MIRSSTSILTFILLFAKKMTKKAPDFITNLGQIQRKCDRLTKLMEKCIKKFDHSLFEFIDRQVIMRRNDEKIFDTWKFNVWFQDRHMHIKIVRFLPEWHKATEFNLTIHSDWTLGERVEISKFNLLEDAIKLAELLCKEFLNKDKQEIRKECIKNTDKLLYEDLYINEKQ